MVDRGPQVVEEPFHYGRLESRGEMIRFQNMGGCLSTALGPAY
jgi:hypothetical protein